MKATTTSTLEGAVRFRTRWLRRRYFIEDRHVKPVANSRPEEYNPFDQEEGEPLHVELARLDAMDDHAVEQFASRWGLLGLFYDPLIVFRYVYADAKHPDPAKRPLLAYSGAELAFPVMPPLELLHMFRETMEAWVSVQRPDRIDPEEQRLLSYAGDYFPEPLPSLDPDAEEGTPEQRLVVLLFYPRRWDYLCEPLASFRQAVAEFQTTYQRCANWSEGRLTAEEDDELKAHLEGHLHQVRPTLEYRLENKSEDAGTTGVELAPGITLRPGPAWDTPPKAMGWQLAWTFPSLLTVAYMLLAQDMTGQRNLRYCAHQTCRKPFIGGRADKRFCSRACMFANKQHKYRHPEEGKERE